IGMWKAFEELEQLGWVKPGRRPRMFGVQSSGCAPVVKAFDDGAAASSAWQNPHTAAAGLRVPKAYGDYILLEIMRESGGMAVAVSEGGGGGGVGGWGGDEGVLLSPEGAAATAAY